MPVGRRVVAHFELKRGHKSAVAERVRRLLHKPGRFVDFGFEAGNRNGQLGEYLRLPACERGLAALRAGEFGFGGQARPLF